MADYKFPNDDIAYRLSAKELDEIKNAYPAFVGLFIATSKTVAITGNISIRVGKNWPAELTVKGGNERLLSHFFRSTPGIVYQPYKVFPANWVADLPGKDAEFGIDIGPDDRLMCLSYPPKKSKKGKK